MEHSRYPIDCLVLVSSCNRLARWHNSCRSRITSAIIATCLSKGDGAVNGIRGLALLPFSSELTVCIVCCNYDLMARNVNTLDTLLAWRCSDVSPQWISVRQEVPPICVSYNAYLASMLALFSSWRFFWSFSRILYVRTCRGIYVFQSSPDLRKHWQLHGMTVREGPR